MKTIYEIALGCSIALIVIGIFILMYLGGIFGFVRSLWVRCAEASNSYPRASDSEVGQPEFHEQISPESSTRDPRRFVQPPYTGKIPREQWKWVRVRGAWHRDGRYGIGGTPFDGFSDVQARLRSLFTEDTYKDLVGWDGSYFGLLSHRARPDWETDELSHDSQSNEPYPSSW